MDCATRGRNRWTVAGGPSTGSGSKRVTEVSLRRCESRGRRRIRRGLFSRASARSLSCCAAALHLAGWEFRGAEQILKTPAQVSNQTGRDPSAVFRSRVSSRPAAFDAAREIRRCWTNKQTARFSWPPRPRSGVHLLSPPEVYTRTRQRDTALIPLMVAEWGSMAPSSPHRRFISHLAARTPASTQAG